MTKLAGARKNGPFGYKAKVTYSDGRVWTPIRHNFPDKEAATAYAQKWIDANDSRPLGVRNAKVKIEAPRAHPEGARGCD